MVRSDLGWGRRSRLRTAAIRFWSLFQVFAVVAASFILLPVFVGAQEPGALDAFVEPGDSRTLRCEFTGQEAHMDDTVYCRLRIGNGTAVDGEYFLFLDRDSYVVRKCPDFGEPGVQDDFDFQTGGCAEGAAREVVDPSDPRWERFVGFWAFSVTTRMINTRSFPEERDVAYDERFTPICEPLSLDEYEGGPMKDDFLRMCPLGVIRGITGPRGFSDTGEPTYERQYLVGMTLRDDGTDQTEFRGWELEFDMIIRAVLDADTCPETRVNGVCTAPLYQRR